MEIFTFPLSAPYVRGISNSKRMSRSWKEAHSNRWRSKAALDWSNRNCWVFFLQVCLMSPCFRETMMSPSSRSFKPRRRFYFFERIRRLRVEGWHCNRFIFSDVEMFWCCFAFLFFFQILYNREIQYFNVQHEFFLAVKIPLVNKHAIQFMWRGWWIESFGLRGIVIGTMSAPKIAKMHGPYWFSKSVFFWLVVDKKSPTIFYVELFFYFWIYIKNQLGKLFFCKWRCCCKMTLDSSRHHAIRRSSHLHLSGLWCGGTEKMGGGDRSYSNLDVSKSRGLENPQMDGENNGKPYEQMGWFGVNHPLFLETPISEMQQFSWVLHTSPLLWSNSCRSLRD